MNRKTDGTPYTVTVHVDGHPDWKWTGPAPRKGLAETRAMAEYPYSLRGQLVTYTTEQI